jgi:Cu(I)/Ag(I) efflux system membrane protein CusA/SilA
MIERIIDYCTRNRFMIGVLISVFTLWGIWAVTNTKLDAIPDLSDIQVIIFTEWPGRSPDIMEDQITYPIVTAMLAAPKVKFVRGQSFFGLSFVYIIFRDSTDIYWARSRTIEYLQKIAGQLPEGVTPILGPDATGVGWVYQYALVDETGQHNLQELRSFQDWYLRYWLEAVPGVAEVASVGGYVKQYQVELDPNKLLAYNISVGQVIHAIRRSNNDVGGRTIEFATTEYMVRGRGYIQSVKDIQSIPLGTDGNGTPIFIRDVADTKLGPDIRRGLAELDGKGEVVGGIVVARYGENALNVINRVKGKLKEIEPSLPKGVKLVTTYDRSELIYRAIDTLKEKLLEEMIVVALVTILFLFHIRSALIPIIGLSMAVVMSFIPMYYMGLTANIMSLGGIAIAIGAMVDATIIMVENAHKRLERWEQEGHRESRDRVISQAFQEVGKPLFFSLLIITVSFLPVFTLEAQEGRLFKPLAYTKTFSMFFAALLAITLTPALGNIFIRGKIRSEERQPLSRVLIWLYSPVVDFAVRFRKTIIILAFLITAATAPIFFKLGSEFMPPLNEGAILYMPTAVPGISITEAGKILQTQDRIFRQFPEVVSVFGKIGRSRTSTDPAPLSMVETTVILKPQEDWRQVRQERWYSSWIPGPMKGLFRYLWPEERPMTWDELIADMHPKLNFPGMPPVWWMPVQTRTEMLATGIRSNLGIKVFGPELKTIERVAVEIEQTLKDLPGTRSVFAESGGSPLWPYGG